MRIVILGVVVALLLVSGLSAQGRTDYVNFESPPAHPIEVFRLEGHDFVAACNTRDGSIEIFDTDENVPDRSLARVRVGLEPVSVRFNPATNRLYTANFLGDSISVIELSAPGGMGSLVADLEQTTWVGDEPLDIAFYTLDPGGSPQETLFVTHMALDGFDWRDASTLQPLSGIEMTPAQVSVGFDTSNPPDGIPDEFVDLAAKEPRAVLTRGNELYILPLKGGSNSLDVFDFDMDLWCGDVPSLFASPVYHGDLHTSGLNMAFDAGGTLYIVGGEALNEELFDEPNVMAAPTGFVKSMFYAIQDPCSQNPTVQRRDVNLAATVIIQQIPPQQETAQALPQQTTIIRPVKKGQAMSMLTDVVPFETGGVPKVFFAAFGNDRVGVIEPNPNQSDPNLWKRRRINVPPSQGSPLSGPRGLALKLADPGSPGDPGDRLYVLNHLDASITTIDPVTEAIVAGADLALAVDPRPDHLTVGQQFLYDAKQGNGFNSCASCHVDGRLDRRAWDLGTPDDPPVQIPAILPDAIDETEFPADKGFMMTQSLQGLLNSEVAPPDQFWVTNAPYHWRGDRASFRDFNPAFAGLLGGAELSDENMAAFEEFINTIAYPPNPKERRDRVPSGDFGVGEDITSDGSTGAFRGMKIFHVEPTVGQRGCATGCHSLPEGSNNRLTDVAFTQPIETAALRGLFQKEAKRDLDGSSDPKDSAYTGIEGLFNTGFGQGSTLQEFNVVASINGFNKTFFLGELCPPGVFCDDLQDLNQFVHEMDWSMGPMVGCPATVDFGNVAAAYPGNPASTGCDGACTDLASTLDCMEQQAHTVDSGIAVQTWIGDQDRGFWYDSETGMYVEEPDSGTTVDRAGLLDKLGDGDRAVFQAVPLGSERRVAAPSGVADPLPDGLPAPSSIELLPMVPSTMYQRIPELTGAWADIDNVALESIFLHSARLFQWGLIQDAAGENGFGLGTSLRHDAPRRFEVSGKDVRHGAYLVLAYFNDPNAGPPNPALPLDQGPFQLISLPLYASPDANPLNDDPVWRTAVEFDPLFYYGLMLGGPAAPGVAAAYLDQRPFTFPMVDPVLDQSQPGEFDPVGWNFLYVFVVNTDGQIGDGGWQRLRIQ